MDISRENIFIVIGAVVAVLVQLVVAPYIAIANALPNFIVAYVLVVSVLRPRSSRTVMLAFLMGLAYNLFVGGPVGSMSVILIVLCVVAANAMVTMANDTMFMPLAIVAAGLLACEVVYLLVLLGFGLELGLGGALLGRTLPCFLYDCVAGLLVYLVMRRLAQASDRVAPNNGPTLLR